MYTEKERKILKKALERVRKCDGDCRSCEKIHIYTFSNSKSIYMAYGCDLLPQEYFTYISDHINTLRQDAIELLEFELS